MTDDSSEKQEKTESSPVKEANFLQFLYGMFTQTLMQLGMLSNPFTGKTEADLVQAKYSIDLMLIFRDKTKGNLTDEEAEYMERVISELQMGYVDALEREKKPENTQGGTSWPSGANNENPTEDPEQDS